MTEAVKSHDLNGREYLKLADAKEGLIELDDGFTCHQGGKAMLYSDGDGGFYFYCNSGKHDIGGQADDGIHCIGVYPLASGTPT